MLTLEACYQFCKDSKQTNRLYFKEYSRKFVIINLEEMNKLQFFGDKSYFSSIPVEKREEYIQRMLSTPHQSGVPKLPKAQYPHQSTFKYKHHTMNYYHTAINPNPTALLFYLHGLNSYGGSSSYLGTTVAATIPNVNVYALDFLNFGKSDGGYKGLIQSFSDIVNQAECFVDYICQQFANGPKTFLIGCSFGGTISYKMTLRNPKKYDGVVFFVPALREVKQSQYIMKKIGKLVGYFFPKLKLTEQGEDDTKFRVKEIVEMNTLNYMGRNIPGTIRVVLNAIEEVENSYHMFSTPYIVFQSGIDKMVDPFAPLDLQKACKTKDKTTIYLKDMWHSIFYEQQIDMVVDITTQWLGKRL